MLAALAIGVVMAGPVCGEDNSAPSKAAPDKQPGDAAPQADIRSLIARLDADRFGGHGRPGQDGPAGRQAGRRVAQG